MISEVAESVVDTSSQLLPPFNLYLHNDNHNLMDYVTWSLVTVLGKSETEATNLMLEAHVNNSALVATGPLERIEFYAEMFSLGRGLTVSIEKAD